MLIEYKYSKLYWFLRDFEWLEVYFSPFKFFLPKLFFGKTAIGVPYFLPRKWVKATPERAIKATLEEIKEVESFNERNPNYKKSVKTFDEIYESKMRCSYPIPLKVGFSFCGLGWKTKWTSTDFRHEWNPVWSFVFFGYQIALIFRPKHNVHFWECWLYYSFTTDKKKTVKERLKQAREEFPCTWTSFSNGEKKKTCYWNLTLKNKWKNN